MDLLKKMIMKGLLRKIEERWMVGTVCYADLWSNYIPLHPDHVKEIEEWLFDNPGVIYHSQEVEFEIVRYCKKHNSDPSKNSVCTLDCGYEEVSYVKLITSKEQQKQLITEIMDLDAEDGLYEDEVSPTYTGEYPFPPKDRYDTVNDIEKLAEQYVNTNYPEYTNPKEKAAAIEDVCWGYNKAKETLYTEEQVREAMSMARKLSGVAYTNDEIIQSLKKLKKD